MYFSFCKMCRTVWSLHWAPPRAVLQPSAVRSRQIWPDLVITKSVSRFCRNTLDGLEYIRRLKKCGVGV